MFREWAGRRSINGVSEVEDVVEEFIRQEGETIYLKKGEKEPISNAQRGRERLALTFRAIT